MPDLNPSEIQSLIEKSLTKENLKNITVDIEGTSEKGDGFSGDIIFVNVKGLNSITNQQKQYHLVLKCSKNSETLRNALPVQEAFLSEINFYETVLPTFQQFQQSKSVKNVFKSVPKYYGSVTTPISEVLVMENLKKNGYELWGTKEALTLEHILMVVEQYGLFHSISVAMQDQNAEQFNKIKQTDDLMKKFSKSFNFVILITNTVDDTAELLKDICEENIWEKFKQCRDQVEYAFGGMRDEGDLKVISHGDCWTNNFMFKHNSENKTKPENVAIIDWQISTLISPIFDLAYFTFACISVKDLENYNLVLDRYYNSFSQSLKELGSNPEKLYPKKVFLEDWKKFARFGFMMCLAGIKMAFTKKEDLPDLSKESENGFDAESLMFKMSNVDGYKKRILPMIEYAVRNQLLD